MWPKVIAELFELLPHVSRVLPLADRYLSSRSSADSAMTALGESVHADLGRVAKAHMALAEQLDAFAAQVSEGTAEARKARVALESVEARLTRMERAANVQRGLTVLACVLLVVAVVLLVVLVSRGRP